LIVIQLHHDTHILVATQPADFRKGIDGFVAVCRDELDNDPRSGIYFVFINQNRTMIRVLAYDGSGFWLMTKRLSNGRFQGWPKSPSNMSVLDAKSLRSLLTANYFSPAYQHDVQ